MGRKIVRLDEVPLSPEIMTFASHWMAHAMSFSSVRMLALAHGTSWAPRVMRPDDVPGDGLLFIIVLRVGIAEMVRT